MLSETVQFEQMMNEKSSMEEESRHLDEAQKQLKIRAKVLAEKIIQELRKKNIEKKQAVDQLQSKIGNLEAQLNALSVSDIPPAPAIEETAEVKEATETAEPPNEGFAEEMPETDENVTIAAVEEEEIEVQESSQERKKHKFF